MLRLGNAVTLLSATTDWNHCFLFAKKHKCFFVNATLDELIARLKQRRRCHRALAKNPQPPPAKQTRHGRGRAAGRGRPLRHQGVRRRNHGRIECVRHGRRRAAADIGAGGHHRPAGQPAQRGCGFMRRKTHRHLALPILDQSRQAFPAGYDQRQRSGPEPGGQSGKILPERTVKKTVRQHGGKLGHGADQKRQWFSRRAGLDGHNAGQGGRIGRQRPQGEIGFRRIDDTAAAAHNRGRLGRRTRLHDGPPWMVVVPGTPGPELDLPRRTGYLRRRT